MSTSTSTYDDKALVGNAVGRDARALLGQVMGYVAVTVGFSALGAYLGRDLSGGAGILFFIGAFALIFGLNAATSKGREQLAIALLFPSALGQTAGATAAFVAALGAYGYATSRDLSSWARPLFWALLALIVFGLVALFVSIPGSHVVYALAGLGIFGAFTIVDFNRLRHDTDSGPVLIASSIFLDIFNIFLLLLDLFGGSSRD
jgi:uncharacterized protein